MSQDLPNPQQSNPYEAPVQDGPLEISPDQQGDGTGGMIPYKNPAALFAYYLGLFSLLPLIGLFLAVPAFVLGILGLRARKKNPVVRGSVHAWIGIILGGIFTIIWGLSVVAIFVGVVVR
jgi:hypothetical protein